MSETPPASGHAIPAGACDTHMHIFGRAAQYPYVADRDYTPDDALMEAYLAMRDGLGLDRTVVVQPSVYGLDHACTLAAVKALGNAGRGVAVLEPSVPDGVLDGLHDAGFRGTRLNLVNAGGVASDQLEAIAKRVADRGWHVQVMTTGARLPDIALRLANLPTDVVIDHMGRMDADAGTDQDGFKALLGLLETGRCWVKLSGAYRIDFTGAPWPKARPFAEALIRAAPERLVWATDWPHPDLGASPPPSADALLDALLTWVPDAPALQRILVDNPATLYRFR